MRGHEKGWDEMCKGSGSVIVCNGGTAEIVIVVKVG